MDIKIKRVIGRSKAKTNTSLYAYISAVSFIAFIFLLYLIKTYDVTDKTLLIVFSLLCVVAETFLIPMPKIGAVSVSYALTFSAILLTDPLTVAIISSVGVALRCPYVEGKGRVNIFNNPIYKTIFNVSQYIIITGAGSIVYEIADKIIDVGFVFFNPIASIFSLIIYIFLNSLFMAILMSLILNKKVIDIWKNSIFGILYNVVLVSLLGIVIAFSCDSYGVGGIILFFIPLMFARYTFKLYLDMRKNYFESINMLIRTIEANDPYTSGHSVRVSAYAESIARKLNLPQSKIDLIKSAGLLHDIGKIGIDKGILNKTGKLEKNEFEVIKCHPQIGATIISDLSFLSNLSDIIRHHHERNDGSGYPDGLDHEKITLETSILTIADSFDAMTTNRPYRDALDLEYSLREIKDNAGTQFNPDIVDVAVIALRESYNIINNY
ncbi:putative nucleotidyltransferase with HDIG domain [Sedimentibacter acidaminivorans]|uniref:Nucleotidyltransferase with HDIG domain n=1 Tax=Sedimentibacter acidaminivorans TaxID=913099 RepID=A0ABS4GEU2_9FIRM|nr:HD domain-containing phosphohydrolase [Sedimentibacter acidaminivorans]MBP1926211.1 putative nucleotidyltransferase with HDIG domain [Sedimentibacter acidaminivorans]